MRALVMQQAGEPLAVETVDDPTPGHDDLVLKVEACGICGSDLHLHDAMPLPGHVLGHEFCGEVVAVGHDVEGWVGGDRAVGLSLETCGVCLPCREGRVRKCERAQMVGVERPGAYAEYLRLPARDALRLPEPLDHRHGALIEPLAIALHTIERAGLSHGEDVLVLGGGPVGLAVTAWLQTLGAREVVVSDPAEGRRALAEQVGATATVDPSSDDVAEAFARLTGDAPSVVIECVGVPGLLQHACDVAGVDARVVVCGVCLQPDQLTQLVPMSKELDVRFAFYYRRQDFTTTMDMIERGRLDPLPLVTDEVSLDAASERFESLKSPNLDAKVLIRP